MANKTETGESGVYIVEEYVNEVAYAGWREWSNYRTTELNAKRMFDIIRREQKNKTMRLVMLVV